MERIDIVMGAAIAYVKKVIPVMIEKKVAESATAGPRGERGEQGMPGDKGDAGPQGERGEKGERGDRGPQGFKGDAGARGPTGAKGDRGDQGPAGVPGERGLQGPEGKRGDTGPAGARGKAGPVGPAGPKGDTGAEGPQGPVGERGAIGPKGDTGPRGERGPEGKIGPQGPKGDAGPQGPQGEKGETGLTPDISQLQRKIQDELDVLRAMVQSKISQLAMAGGTHSGGGSTKILDNDDVVFARASQISEECLLIFNPAIKKFEIRGLDSISLQGEIMYTRLVDVSGAFTYVGEATPGTLTNAATWRIKRIEDLGSGDLEVKWADGTANFTKVWNDRATYTYG